MTEERTFVGMLFQDDWNPRAEVKIKFAKPPVCDPKDFRMPIGRIKGRNRVETEYRGSEGVAARLLRMRFSAVRYSFRRNSS